jgi:hypothetical protein
MEELGRGGCLLSPWKRRRPATLRALYPAARLWSPRAYGRPLHSPPSSKMRQEKTFLPLVGKQNHGGTTASPCLASTNRATCSLARWRPGPVRSRPTDQWLSGYITNGDGVPKEPTVGTMWIGPKCDPTVGSSRSGKRTASVQPHRWNGRSGFS